MKIPSKKRPHPSKYAGISPNILLKKRNIVSNNDDKRRDIDCKKSISCFINV
jgi:hypothetical protein